MNRNETIKKLYTKLNKTKARLIKNEYTDHNSRTRDGFKFLSIEKEIEIQKAYLGHEK